MTKFKPSEIVLAKRFEKEQTDAYNALPERSKEYLDRTPLRKSFDACDIDLSLAIPVSLIIGFGIGLLLGKK